MNPNAIEIRGLTKSFCKFRLGPLDLTVPRGSIYGFVGPNGAGKTTTLDLLLGMGSPDGGRIVVDGLDHARDEVAVKQRIGYVSPDLDFRMWGKIGKAIRFVLAVALNARTNARTLLSLSLRASELGTTFWWIAVPLSALAPTAGLAVGWIVSGLFGNSVPVDVAALFRFLLLTQSVSAFQFTVLCFMSNADTSDPREKILGGFTGAFWGIGLSACCSFTLFWTNAQTVWDPLSWGILAMGAVCGLVSWHRRTAFLLQRARKNEGATPAARPTGSLPQASRLDGFVGLYLRTLFRWAGGGLILNVVVGGILAWSGNMTSKRIGSVWVVMGALAGVMTCLGSLRHWRTLPISAERISWVMIGLLLTGWSGWMLPLIAMNCLVGQTLGWSESGLLVLAGGLFAVLLAFALRFGMKWFMLLLWFVLIAPPMLSLVLGRFSEEGGRHPATVASVLAGVLLLVIAQAWMTRTLRHQSRIFSPGFHQFGRLKTAA